MPRNKSITSIDNRIKKVQEDLFKTKARLDKLTAELRELEREKKLRQADAILQALSNRDFARIIFSGNSPRSTPPRRGFSYATASSSQ